MADMKKLKPLIKFNSGSGAILCNKCRIIIKENLTKVELSGDTGLVLCNKCLEELVYGFDTTYKEGFTHADYERLLQVFPKINMERFDDALSGITCVVQDGQVVIYHCDILLALKLGTQDRNMKSYEWD